MCDGRSAYSGETLNPRCLIGCNAPALRQADRYKAAASRSFSWKHFHNAGAFAVRSCRLGFHWFRSFLVKRGLA
jgi:hypothetical protein